MNIAVILPSLKNKAPVQVAKDIVDILIFKGCSVEVFYIKNIVELSFNCPTRKINFFKKFDYEKYDVIHSHMIKPDFYIWLHRKSIKSLCVSTLHNEIDKVLKDYYGVLISKIVTPLWTMFLKAHDQVVCLSEYAKTCLQKKHRMNNIICIHNGRTVSGELTNTDDVELLKGITHSYTTLGVIANISKIKGIEQIINSLYALVDYCLIIIGDGPDLARLKKLVREKGLSDRCIFFGHKENAHVFLEHIDIYMMTSYSEGFPLVLIEAAQYKKPIVCSSLPIFKEFFNSSQVSFFDLDNKESLINAVKAADYKKKQLSNNIYEVYLQRYTKEKMGFKYYQNFKKLILSKKF